MQTHLFLYLAIIGSIGTSPVLAQTDLSLILPEGSNWQTVKEGEAFQFTLEAVGGSGPPYSFQYRSNGSIGAELNEDSVFSWTPNFNIVSQKEQEKAVNIQFQVTDAQGNSAFQDVEFMVQNTNRIPPLTDLQPFFIKPDTKNTYTLPLDSERFALSEPSASLPAGMTATTTDDGKWQLNWQPGREQFATLRQETSVARIEVRDRKYDDKAMGEVSLLPASTTAQEKPASASIPLELSFPRTSFWNVVDEGKVLSFKLAAKGGKNYDYSFRVVNADEFGIQYDSLGNVYWKPSYDFVDRLTDTRQAQVIFEVSNAEGETKQEVVRILVNHINRPPEVGDLRNFYVSFGKENIYSLSATNAITDPDDDPVIYKPVLAKMPQGMTLSADGEIRWSPSMSQYNRLQREPMLLPFLVEDQPYEARTQGILRIQVTQEDLPPDITMVPNQDYHEINEDEELQLKFHLSDPNGDDDIESFDFVSSDGNIPRSALISNHPTQWEFRWEPGYDFMLEPGDTSTIRLTFFVLDKSNQRQERRIRVKVQDAENLAEKDQLYYNQYRTALVRVMNLMNQLQDRQKVLQKEYKKAKRGKKQRAITTASLGAATGLSPIILSDNTQTQQYVAGVGGTTSMTIGSLEASNVIGKDASNIYENLSYINQKLTELQTQGNLFAGKYALSINRRNKEFSDDLRKLIMLLNLDKVTQLELDPSWKNPRKASDKNIKESFSDYNPDPDRSPFINE